MASAWSESPTWAPGCERGGRNGCCWLGQAVVDPYTAGVMTPSRTRVVELVRRTEEAMSHTRYGATSSRLLRRGAGALARRSRALVARADRLRFGDEAAYLDHVVADAISAARSHE